MADNMAVGVRPHRLAGQLRTGSRRSTPCSTPRTRPPATACSPGSTSARRPGRSPRPTSGRRTTRRRQRGRRRRRRDLHPRHVVVGVVRRHVHRLRVDILRGHPGRTVNVQIPIGGLSRRHAARRLLAEVAASFGPGLQRVWHQPGPTPRRRSCPATTGHVRRPILTGTTANPELDAADALRAAGFTAPRSPAATSRAVHRPVERHRLRLGRHGRPGLAPRIGVRVSDPAGERSPRHQANDIWLEGSGSSTVTTLGDLGPDPGQLHATGRVHPHQRRPIGVHPTTGPRHRSPRQAPPVHLHQRWRNGRVDVLLTVAAGHFVGTSTVTVGPLARTARLLEHGRPVHKGRLASTLGTWTVSLEDPTAGYFCSSLDLGYPTARDVVTNNPDADGAVDRTQYFGLRTINVEIEALSGAGARVDQVAGLFAPFVDPAARPVLHYVLDRGANPERTMTLRAAGFAWPIQGPYQRSIQLQFVAADPVAYDPTPQTVTATVAAAATLARRPATCPPGPGLGSPGRSQRRRQVNWTHRSDVRPGLDAPVLSSFTVAAGHVRRRRHRSAHRPLRRQPGPAPAGVDRLDGVVVAVGADRPVDDGHGPQRHRHHRRHHRDRRLGRRVPDLDGPAGLGLRRLVRRPADQRRHQRRRLPDLGEPGAHHPGTAALNSTCCWTPDSTNPCGSTTRRLLNGSIIPVICGLRVAPATPTCCRPTRPAGR